MCLGVPGRIVEIDSNGFTATVDFFGVRRVVRLELVDEPVAPGDYVLNHVGYAIRRIPAENIDGTLELYEQLQRPAADRSIGELKLRDPRRAAALASALARVTASVNRSPVLRASFPRDLNVIMGSGCPVCITVPARHQSRSHARRAGAVMPRPHVIELSGRPG